MSRVSLLSISKNTEGKNSRDTDNKKVPPQTVIHFIKNCWYLPGFENEKQVNEFFEQVEKDLK